MVQSISGIIGTHSSHLVLKEIADSAHTQISARFIYMRDGSFSRSLFAKSSNRTLKMRDGYKAVASVYLGTEL